MNDHFIKNIEIKNFKCFEDFTAEGFGRVNLIGGKNNVGKTAFMEAVCIHSSKNKNEAIRHIIRARYISDILVDLLNEVGKRFIQNFIDEKTPLYQNGQIKSNLGDSKVVTLFNSQNKKSKRDYDNFYSLIITNELEEILDNYLNGFDNTIEKFRIINGEPHCRKNGKFYSLNEFGDGLGKYISLVITLLTFSNGIILIDEIENGIHYTQLDKLWEIILTVSKEQNVQVFATTHSKECIESYARVAKKLADEEVTYSLLTRLKSGKIHASVRDFELLDNSISQEHEVR